MHESSLSYLMTSKKIFHINSKQIIRNLEEDIQLKFRNINVSAKKQLLRNTLIKVNKQYNVEMNSSIT